MKHLSIKKTIYPIDKPKMQVIIPLDFSKPFWTNFNEDKYLQLVEAKKQSKY